jgi:hypothetical protein
MKNPRSPDDIRKKGWVVGIHNDYFLKGKFHTFWLFTNKSGRFLKGEGTSDAQALNKVRAQLKKR